MDDDWIYEITMEDNTVVYVSGDGKNDAWAKVHFDGYMTDSWSPEEWAAKWAPPAPPGVLR